MDIVVSHQARALKERLIVSLLHALLFHLHRTEEQQRLVSVADLWLVMLCSCTARIWGAWWTLWSATRRAHSRSAWSSACCTPWFCHLQKPTGPSFVALQPWVRFDAHHPEHDVNCISQVSLMSAKGAPGRQPAAHTGPTVSRNLQAPAAQSCSPEYAP